MNRMGIALSIAVLGLAACSDDPDPPVTPMPPTEVSLVATGEFESPLDGVASPDGMTFYFTAYDTSAAANAESSAAIYSVPSAGGTPTVLFEGPPLEDPTGLVLSCDGETLYVADLSYSEGADIDGDDADLAPLHQFDLAGNQLSPFSVTGIAEATGLALGVDCNTLYVTGYTLDREPALFSVPVAGGAATVVKSGAPLVSPTGVHIDVDNVAWVMDQLPDNGTGGVLFAITADGATTEVIDQLRMSEPAGVSLVSAGGIAVIPNRDPDGNSYLLTVDTATGDTTVVETPEIVESSGIRTAREAPVMIVVDQDGNAIYRAE